MTTQDVTAIDLTRLSAGRLSTLRSSATRVSTTVVVRTRRQPTQARAVAAIETILDAAARLLVDEGFAATTTTRVAASAEVSVGALYQYFPNRAALITAVAQRHAGRMLELVVQAGAATALAPVPQVVRALCSALLAAHALAPELNRVLVQHIPQVGVQHRHEMERSARSLVRALLVGHASEIQPQDLDAASFVLVAMVEGVIYSALLAPSDAVDFERVTRELEMAVLRYLLAASDIPTDAMSAAPEPAQYDS